jgi:hypothetical protein
MSKMVQARLIPLRLGRPSRGPMYDQSIDPQNASCLTPHHLEYAVDRVKHPPSVCYHHESTCLVQLPVLRLRGRVVLDQGSNLLLVVGSVLLEQVERVSLCGRVGVGFIQKRLNAEENLLDCDGGLPALLLVQD